MYLTQNIAYKNQVLDETNNKITYSSKICLIVGRTATLQPVPAGVSATRKVCWTCGYRGCTQQRRRQPGCRASLRSSQATGRPHCTTPLCCPTVTSSTTAFLPNTSAVCSSAEKIQCSAGLEAPPRTRQPRASQCSRSRNHSATSAVASLHCCGSVNSLGCSQL